MAAPIAPLDINKLEDSATGRAIAAVQQGQGTLDQFVDFTTSLVRDVFRTLVDSSIEQLEAYADLVAKVSGTLADYEVKMVGDAAAFDKRGLSYMNEVVIPAFAASPFPAPFTLPVPNTSITLDAAKLDDLKAAFAGVTASIQNVDKALEDVIISGNPPPTIPADLLHLFCVAKLKKDLKASYETLVTILKLGMQKLVITDGEIKTSLTFHVDAADSDVITSSQTEQDYNQKTMSWGVSGGFGGSRSLTKKLAGNMISRSLGGSISGGISGSRFSSQLKVNVMNETKSAVTNTSIDITGGVTIHFKSDYFPSIDPAAIQP